MSAPHALIEFFQKEAMEYLGRLDQMMADAEEQTPDAALFLTNARALRGSATMTRLEGLPDLATTIERIATGLRDNELRWDQRLHFAVRGALVELRSLVERAGVWTDVEQRHSRTQSVALAAVAAGYLATDTPAASPATQVIPIARFFPDDGMPAILQRSAQPPITLAQRFRTDIAAAADGVARESAALATSAAGPSQLALADGVRRSLLGLADVAESYGAASIATMATRMARAPLASPHERQGVQSVARLLMDREITDQQLAQQVKQVTITWSGAPAPEAAVVPAVIPIESLLYRGHSAITRARTVRDELKTHWQRGTLAEPAAHSLFEELSDLLDLAVTT
jgi:chemotaxis protein histidine kinase CheA